MKKIVTFSLIILSTALFSFSEMEGPFKGGTKENPYYFLYNKTTGYTIRYIPRLEIPNNDILRFLKGNPNFLDNNSISTPQLYNKSVCRNKKSLQERFYSLGLAEDKTTTQKFHWTIDLRDDLSTLTN